MRSRRRSGVVASGPARVRWSDAVRRRDARGPCGDAPRGCRGRLGSACADGIRASSRDAGYWAGTFACSLGTAPASTLEGSTDMWRGRATHGSCGAGGAGTKQQPDAARLVHDTGRPVAGSNSSTGPGEVHRAMRAGTRTTQAGAQVAGVDPGRGTARHAVRRRPPAGGRGALSSTAAWGPMPAGTWRR